jgi:UDP-glucose 4-epimerase
MNLEGATALVTGAAGFIGSHLSGRLIGMNARVIGVDDLSSGNSANLDGLSNESKFDLEHGSVTDPKLIGKLLAKSDLVFHTAALNLVASIEDPFRDLEINAGGTLNILSQASQSDRTKVVVFSSTGSVYGEPKYIPQDEGHPLDPVSPYGISKLAAERYCMAWAGFAGQQTVSLRYFNVYGPRQRLDSGGGVVPIFLTRAMSNKTLTIYGTGEQRRCFTYVDDIVSATVNAAIREDAWNGVYNAATKQVTTINELAEQAIKSTGSSSKIEYDVRRAGDIDDNRPDGSLAAEKIGFTAGTLLSDGIASTAQWIEEQINAGA